MKKGVSHLLLVVSWALCAPVARPAVANAFRDMTIQVTLEKAVRRDKLEVGALIGLPSPDTYFLFTQLGVCQATQGNSLSIGFGYRYTPLIDMLLGLNGFIDHDTKNKLSRFAVGAEAQYETVSLVVNYYPAGERTTALAYYDHSFFQRKAAAGFEIRLKASNLKFPWVVGKVGFERYKGNRIQLISAAKAQPNPYAMSVGFEITPIPLISLTYAYKLGKKVELCRLKEHQFEISFKFRLLENFEHQLNRMKVAQWQSVAGSRTALVNRQTLIMTDTIFIEPTKEEQIKRWIKARGNYDHPIGDIFAFLLVRSAHWPKDLGLRIHPYGAGKAQTAAVPAVFDPEGSDAVTEYLELRLDNQHFTPAYSDGTTKYSVKGDGDCFFYSVHQQLSGERQKTMGLLHKAEGATVSILRERIADALTPEAIVDFGLSVP